MPDVKQTENPVIKDPAPQADVTQKPLEEMTVEELKAEAERIEEENKTLRDSGKEAELKSNYMRRVEKALHKQEMLKFEQYRCRL